MAHNILVYPIEMNVFGHLYLMWRNEILACAPEQKCSMVQSNKMIESKEKHTTFILMQKVSTFKFQDDGNANKTHEDAVICRVLLGD